jgi:hypothetical protein
LRALWERFLDYELGQLHFVGELMKEYEKRDPASILPEELPEPVKFESQRNYINQVLAQETNLRAVGPRIVPATQELPDSPSVRYRAQLNREGSPSELVAAGYLYRPGTELLDRAEAAAAYQGRLQ